MWQEIMPVFENLVFAAVMLSFQMNYEFKKNFQVFVISGCIKQVNA